MIAISVDRQQGRYERTRLLLVLAAILAVLFAGVLRADAYAPAFPSIIPLPDGWQPEGIATGRGTDFYVGSLAGGKIYKGDLRTGIGDVLAPAADGRVVVGIKVDARTNFLFAAGGGTGNGYVFNADTGALLATYEFATAPTFINDVVITRDAAWFTDSQKAVLYRVALGPGGELAAPGEFDVISLDAPYQFLAGMFNANGIDATPNGKYLIIVNSTTGLLYRMDTATEDLVEIDLGGETLTQGDGILLVGKTLYVVRNRQNRIAVVELNADFSSGEVVDYITNSAFRVPTTVAQHGSRLYAVNARFGTPPGPDVEYEVVQVSR